MRGCRDPPSPEPILSVKMSCFCRLRTNLDICEKWMLGNHRILRVLARPVKGGSSNTVNCLRSSLPWPLDMRIPSLLSQLSRPLTLQADSGGLGGTESSRPCRQICCAVGARGTTFNQASLGHGQGDLISKYRLQPSLGGRSLRPVRRS